MSGGRTGDDAAVPVAKLEKCAPMPTQASYEAVLLLGSIACRQSLHSHAPFPWRLAPAGSESRLGRVRERMCCSNVGCQLSV